MIPDLIELVGGAGHVFTVADFGGLLRASGTLTMPQLLKGAPDNSHVPPEVALVTARFRTIVKRLSSASARPTEIPQVRAATAFPHRFPTDQTAFPGTRRHTC